MKHQLGLLELIISLGDTMDPLLIPPCVGDWSLMQCKNLIIVVIDQNPTEHVFLRLNVGGGMWWMSRYYEYTHIEISGVDLFEVTIDLGGYLGWMLKMSMQSRTVRIGRTWNLDQDKYKHLCCHYHGLWWSFTYKYFLGEQTIGNYKDLGYKTREEGKVICKMQWSTLGWCLREICRVLRTTTWLMLHGSMHEIRFGIQWDWFIVINSAKIMHKLRGFVRHHNLHLEHVV